MESQEGFSNAELLARLAGKSAAAALLERYGGLTNLAQASFDELQITHGVGRSKAAASPSVAYWSQERGERLVWQRVRKRLLRKPISGSVIGTQPVMNSSPVTTAARIRSRPLHAVALIQ